METFEIHFQPDGLRITVDKGTLVSDAMKEAGMEIQLLCGGTGTCGKCTVEIHPDAPAPTASDLQHLTQEELDDGMRLACQTRIDRPMSILISPGIRVMDGKILVDGIAQSFEMMPNIVKKYLELPVPSLDDQVADLFRVKRALGFPGNPCPEIGLTVLKNLPTLIRNHDYKITVTYCGQRICALEPGDTTDRLYGMAFDIGTTTVVGTIIDLNTGRELAHASRLNAQVVYGEDTISRIKYVMEHENGRTDMYNKIHQVVNDIIKEACAHAGIEPGDIYEATFVGNTTMSHLFLGLDPTWLSQIPFTPVTNAPITLQADEAGVHINPNGIVYCLPNIAGFVGADTVAVMLACDYLEPGPTQLAVDVGTNGELALRHDGALTVCSTAAGPALEGAALTCGMRAANGAIEHFRIMDDALEIDVIGDTPPIGICGSGIIDVVAELLETGIIDRYGAIKSPAELGDTVPGYLLDHIITLDGEPAFLLFVPQSGEAHSRRVVLSQKDIRQIQLAKGAIRTGINLLLSRSGLTSDDLDEILLAGAFGNYIKKGSAQRIGLLPDVPPERIRFIGNAASTGAKMALLSTRLRSEADRIRTVAEHVELAALDDFNNEFMNSMLFP